MLLFGLAWVASWMSSCFAQSSCNLQFYLQGSLLAQQQVQSTLATVAAQTHPHPPLAPTLRSPQVQTAATLPPVASASLLPNWLASQGSILELAQPLARWLTAWRPFQGDRPDPLPDVRNTWAVGDLSCLSGTHGLRPHHTTQYPGFSTWLRSCLLVDIAETDPAASESLARRMEEALRAAQWQGDSIQPTLAENLPAAKVGDRLLFIITPEMATALHINGEILATQWVNQLRIALGAEPLTLVDSQMLMHGLKRTGDYLEGDASWYGPYFHGKLTATGEIFDKQLFTAAHKELPLDTYLKVTNLKTGDTLIVRVNDRGPYVGDRMLDLSQGAAQYLGSENNGVVPIRAEVLEPADRLQASLPYRAIKPLQDPLITMWRP